MLIVLSLEGLQFQCNKYTDCRAVVNNFEIAIKAFPDNDSLNVNDTVGWKLMPKILKDTHT